MSEANYTYLGSDGRQAGPYDLPFIQACVSAGTIRRETLVWRSDLPDWLPAGRLTELVWPESVRGTAATMPSLRADRPSSKDVDPAVLAEMRGHASWFWIIAVVNVVFTFIGRSTAEGDEKTVQLVAGLLNAAIFAVVGFFAHRAHRWAFVVGLVLLGIDLVFLVLSMSLFGIVIRGFALYQVFQGYQIARGIHRTLHGSR
jgi:hypothetical protein